MTASLQRNDGRPRVSIGLPVYNGDRFVARAVESVLAQTYTDFELIISDNASEDETADICQRYARGDSRIRYDRNDYNIGQIANVNRVFELARGEYFKWVGYDDWLEPNLLEETVAALDRNPQAVLVTCYQKHYEDNGQWHYAEYTGPRVDSPDAAERFRRMLWFLRNSRYLLDPLYGLMRARALRQTGMLRPMLGCDRLLAVELSLLGPFCHVPKGLQHRRVTPEMEACERLRWFAPQGGLSHNTFAGWCRMASSVLQSAPIPLLEKARCRGALLDLFLRTESRRVRHWCSRRPLLRAIHRSARAIVRRREPVGQPAPEADDESGRCGAPTAVSYPRAGPRCP